MQEFLDKAERTGPATDKPAKGAAQHPHGADHIKAEIILPVFQGEADACKELLERAYRAICGGSRAGIAV
jgi:hypothetical protein